VAISVDALARAVDRLFVERFRRTVNHHEGYPQAYVGCCNLRSRRGSSLTLAPRAAARSPRLPQRGGGLCRGLKRQKRLSSGLPLNGLPTNENQQDN
jgi:hypothetical protein